MTFTNTVKAQAVSQTASANLTLTLQQLLGASIAGRKVVLQKIIVEALPRFRVGTTTGGNTAPQLQLQVFGDIWTGNVNNQVAQKPFKLASLTVPTRYTISAFLPTMRVPLDSESTVHGLRIASDIDSEPGSSVEYRITTHVTLLPQQDLTTL